MRISDWSSDVCSSDLHIGIGQIQRAADVARPRPFDLDDARAEIAEPQRRRRARQELRHIDDEQPVERRRGRHRLFRYRSLSAASADTAPSSARNAVLRRSEAACRSEEHTSELQSLMRISYAHLCLKKHTRT